MQAIYVFEMPVVRADMDSAFVPISLMDAFIALLLDTVFFWARAGADWMISSQAKTFFI